MLHIRWTSLLFCLALSLSGVQARTAKRSDVYIAGFFPYGDGVENSYTGRGVMPSVKLALGHVNEHPRILTNYRLHMWWNDTQCNAAVGVKSFFDMMHSGPNKVMLFGAACTHVTDPIAKASKHWHLTQLSYADTHPMFTKDAFPNFFRVVPSENAFNAPRLALLREFNWTRVGTVYQNEPRYSLPHNHMVADLDSMELEVVETQSFVNDVAESLKKLREKDVRIILGNFNEHFARKVFCEAYKLEMFGRSYQWLIMATYSTDWWNVTQDSECTVEQIAIALEGAILVDLLPLSTSGDITVAGITADEYLVEYDRLRGSEYSRFHGYTYDGIWAAALAIQYVAEKRDDMLTRFDYRVKDWENIFLEALRNTSFEGVTGPVRFYNNERKANILINQFQLGQMEKIGEYHSQQDHLDMTLGKPVRWVGKTPPKDRTLIYIEHSQVNPTIYIVSASASVIGVIIATVFLAFNIKYRNQRYIKMSSPHLNNLIIVGCMLTYLSIIFLGLDTTLSSVAAFPYICTARAWILMAGFSLAFGAMFSKTWRVHSIFTDLKLNKKVIKDYQLFMVVGVLLFIDIAIITTWQIADPFYRETKQLEPKHHENIEDVLVIPENEYCQSEHMTIFVSIIYAYKGLLLVFGAFLAWETRHVSIPALNDSKHIGFSVYNVFITCIAGAAISLVLSDRKDLVFVLLSFFIIFSCGT
ncbi:gamma-aminobutyric acid type B receptor subunit 2 isoform X5 [Drosophila busckii]|uniref:gamma-aminobutyric acid type B receptor subunit 2 isoform X5 n=1 Tax=Drosophila busckii TaxID=30019 RepID=UPI00083F4099|nr:gamma-aminobutyric acid type B receptor subunit 2 isoform X5 [Drosophila busckii]